LWGVSEGFGDCDTADMLVTYTIFILQPEIRNTCICPYQQLQGFQTRGACM